MSIKSILKLGVENLPENFKTQARSVPNMLKKQGVKEEELKYADLDLPQEGVVTKQDLTKAVEGRKDEFGVTGTSNDYKAYSMKEGKTNPTYREKVYTFKQTDVDNRSELMKITEEIGLDANASVNQMIRQAPEREAEIRAAAQAFDMGDDNLTGSRYTSEHFPDVPNYLMHSRIYDDLNTFDQPTRVIQEIQSDLHQQARQKGGYAEQDFQPNELTKKHFAKYQELQKEYERLEEAGEDIWDVWDKMEYTLEDLARAISPEEGILDSVRDNIEMVDDLQELLSHVGKKSDIPQSPYEKSWLAKGMEREVADAIEDGFGQIAIPIKGNVDELHRGSGVQKWYETKVLNTAKKLAKKNGMDFEVVKAGSGIPTIHPDMAKVIYKESYPRKLLGTPTKAEEIASRREGRTMLKDQFNLTGFEANDIINNSKTLEEFTAAVNATLEAKHGTEYAVIKPKGEAGVIPGVSREEVRADWVKLQNASEDTIDDVVAEMQAKYGENAHLLGTNQAALRRAPKSTFTPDKPFAPTLYAGAGVAVGLGAVSNPVEAADPTQPTVETKAVVEQTSTVDLVKSASAALKSGAVTEEQVRQYLIQEGYEEDANAILEDAKIANAAIDQGFPEEDVWNHLGSQERTLDAVQKTKPVVEDDHGFWDSVTDFGADLATGWDRKQKAIYLQQLKMNPNMPLEDFVAGMEALYPNMTSVTTRTAGYFGNEDDYRVAVEFDKIAKAKIVEEAQKQGVNLVWQEPKEDPSMGTIFDSGRWMAQMPDGSMVDVSPGFWAGVRAEANEATGAFVGAIEGGKAASRITKNPYLVGLGTVLGAATGGAFGSQFDYLANAVNLNQDMSAEIAAHRAMTAAEASVIADVIGYPIAKGLGAGYQGILRTKDFIMDGNSIGAVKKLKADLNMSDDEAQVLVANLERMIELPGKKPAQKELAAIVLTQPTMQDVVKVAGTLDSKMARNVAQMVKNRADDLLKSTEDLTSESAGKILSEDLINYTSDVKAFYQGVKETASKHPLANTFDFDFEALAIDPVIKRLKENITDPNVAFKFAQHAKRVQSMSDARDFGSLIELRQLVNDWRFNKRISKHADAQMLTDLVRGIDANITDGAREIMGKQADTWLANFDQAKLMYADMKKLEKNVLYRALRRPGISEEATTKALTRYISSIDGTFNDVMAKLPMGARKRAEGSVINALASKYTTESPSTGSRAVDFVSLAHDLDNVTLTTPMARQMRDAISRMSEVFMNDIPLAMSTGQMPMPKFQSYLTTDPVVRAKYEIASGIFNTIKQYTPGTEQSTNLAIVKNVAKLLENPLNAKSAKELAEAADGDVVVVKQIAELQQQAAKQAAMRKDQGSAKVKLYGNGKVLKLKGEGKAQEIAIHRIATTEKVREIATKYSTDPTDVKAMDNLLKSEGFLAVQQGTDRVRRIK